MARTTETVGFWAWTRQFRTNWIFFSTLTVAAVAMAEIDRMIAQCVTAAGERYTISIAGGLPPRGGAWFGWQTSPVSPDQLIILHSLWDIAFAACYIALGLRLYRAMKFARGPQTWWFVLLGVEIFESILQIRIATMISNPLIAIVVPLAVGAAYLKWILVVGLLLTPLLRPKRRKAAFDLVSKYAAGFWPHLPQLVGVIAIGAFALVPRANLFDQYPDLIRALVNGPRLNPGVVVDTVILFMVFAFVTWLLGLFATGSRAHATRLLSPAYLWWFATGGVLLLTWVLLAVTGQAEPSEWWRFAILIAIALGVPVVSIIWGRSRPSVSPGGTTPSGSLEVDRAFTERVDSEKLGVIARCGDLVAGLVVLVFGAGLVRAFSAPLAIRYTAASDQGAVDALIDWPVALLIVGACVGVMVPHVADRVARLADWSVGGAAVSFEKPQRTKKAKKPTSLLGARKAELLRVGVLALCVAILMIWVLVPVPLAHSMGPVGTIVFVVMLLVIVAWILRAAARLRRPQTLFAKIGFRSDPVLGVATASLLILAMLPNAPSLHSMESAGDVLAQPRQTLEEAFVDWYSSSSCSVQTALTPGGETAHVRPMLVVAAEGGGIRAAAWTARVLDEVMSQVRCDDALTFLSSGVSGGSVGLVVSRIADRASDETSNHPGFDLAVDLAEYEALAVSLSGVLVADTLATVTGARVATQGYGIDGSKPSWQDRAAHMQHTWGVRIDQLLDPFDDEYRPSVGWVTLNASAIGYGCRTVVSQLDLGLSTRVVQDLAQDAYVPVCAGGTPNIANAIDLHELYGDCPLSLDWATAALLSARFPIVSPAARTGGQPGDACADVPDVQISDGGVVDNSGLATLADLMPEVMRIVREKNARIVDPNAATPWIVPIVVYVSSSPGADLAPNASAAWTDVAIAREAVAAGNASQNADRAWLQRLANQTSDACSVWRCERAVAAIRSSVGDGVVVIAPRSGPTVAVPLGWSLSQISVSAIDAEVTRLASTNKKWPTCYGGLRQLLDTLNGKQLTPMLAWANRDRCPQPSD